MYLVRDKQIKDYSFAILSKRQHWYQQKNKILLGHKIPRNPGGVEEPFPMGLMMNKIAFSLLPGNSFSEKGCSHFIGEVVLGKINPTQLKQSLKKYFCGIILVAKSKCCT